MKNSKVSNLKSARIIALKLNYRDEARQKQMLIEELEAEVVQRVSWVKFTVKDAYSLCGDNCLTDGVINVYI